MKHTPVTLALNDRALLDHIRAAVRAVEPAARIILYGSRACGHAAPESDWDLLVLLDGLVNPKREEELLELLYGLELETDTVLNVVVHSTSEWYSPLYQAMPFDQNVTREGIEL